MKTLVLSILFFSFFLNSCNSSKKPENYIDIKVQFNREYTPEERAKIKEASKRFYEHVVIKDNQCIVTAKNGEEIGIPNEFFYIFKMSIDDANETAQKTGYKIEDIKK